MCEPNGRTVQPSGARECSSRGRITPKVLALFRYSAGRLFWVACPRGVGSWSRVGVRGRAYRVSARLRAGAVGGGGGDPAPAVVQPLLDEHGHTIPPSTARFITPADLPYSTRATPSQRSNPHVGSLRALTASGAAARARRRGSRARACSRWSAGRPSPRSARPSTAGPGCRSRGSACARSRSRRRCR